MRNHLRGYNFCVACLANLHKSLTNKRYFTLYTHISLYRSYLCYSLWHCWWWHHWNPLTFAFILPSSASFSCFKASSILCPRIIWSGAYCFFSCLIVCLSVCLSVVNFNIRYNLWTIRDFIFGMHTPLMMPFQMTPRLMTLWPWLWPLR